MARRIFTRLTYLPSLLPRISNLPASRCELLCNSFNTKLTQQLLYKVLHPASFQVSRSYARGKRKDYNIFAKGAPGSKEFRKAWTKQLGEQDCVWTGSEDENDDEKLSPLEKEMRKVQRQAREHGERIDAADSDELHGVWSDWDEEKTLWTGSEQDSDRDMPTEATPNPKSDKYIDRLFEFEELPQLKSFGDALKPENWDRPKVEELSPGKNARKLAVENALKKLKKGPDGRYINVWEVMSDVDILIGAFENIVSGPEYAELREGGPKQLNMEFFLDIQRRMRDPNFRFSREVRLKPKTHIISKKRWQRAEDRRRKDAKR